MDNTPLRYVGHIVRTHAHEDAHATARRVASRHRATLVNVLDGSIKGFTLRRLPNHLVARILADPSVASVEPDLEVLAYNQLVPWSVKRIGAAPVSTKAADIDVHVFVLDTGVLRTHTDLNVVESRSFVPTEPSTNDLNGHGTMVAGCAAARNNGTHVVGVAPGAKIHSYKVLDRSGSGSLSVIVQALDAVVAYKKANPSHAVVANLSLGGYAGTTAYGALDAAIANAVLNHSITVVVAAGNDGRDASLFTPAHTAEALTIGAYDSANAWAPFSNYGGCVDLLAPGKDVPTIGLKSTVVTASGTSFACPYVAGAVAVCLARKPTAGPTDILAVLTEWAGVADPKASPVITGVPTGTVVRSVYVAPA